jgi:hypothetical protein
LKFFLIRNLKTSFWNLIKEFFQLSVPFSRAKNKIRGKTFIIGFFETGIDHKLLDLYRTEEAVGMRSFLRGGDIA